MNKKLKEKDVISQLSAEGYKIPEWCSLSPFEHADRMGGCFGISYGYTKKLGKSYCKTCEYYKDKNNEKVSL